MGSQQVADTLVLTMSTAPLMDQVEKVIRNYEQVAICVKIKPW